MTKSQITSEMLVIFLIQGELGFISSTGKIKEASDALLFLQKLMKNFLNDGGIVHLLGVKASFDTFKIMV